MSDVLLHFVHISDTHILPEGRKPDYSDIPADLELYTRQVLALPYSPTQAAEALVRQINQLPVPVDFVVHTGDIMNDPPAASDYEYIRSLFADCKYPVYYAPGNHDRVSAMQRVLCGREDGNFDHELELHGVQFVFLDSNGSNPPHSGWLEDSQLARLETICAADDDRPLVVILHHHPLAIGVPWLDELRLLNGEALHQVLLKARDRLRGVFGGHIHHGVNIVQDGILYSSAPSAYCQFYGWPGAQITSLEDGARPGLNLVTITKDRTFVRCHRYTI